ncbi:hypothetical protein [Spiroplasma endosymbiont of Dactylopius coccus]
MIILPTLFENKDEIEILSPFPKAIHTSNDIRVIILRQYPNDLIKTHNCFWPRK